MNQFAIRLVGGLFLGLGAVGAGAQAIGPDVIVGNVDGLRRWGASPDGKIQAYSIGTRSCNIGDQPLEWYQATNRHPIIAQNMFRLADGRIEQIGQAWAKWGFAALNYSDCAPCQDPGTTNLLGVHCSDPYSATLNGSQSRLGPKSAVNPFTGAFPVNHASPGSATISGRLQVHTSDVDPNQNAGAQYFVEGQYVTPDDSSALNYRNNTSYRQVWVAADYSLTFTRPAGGVSTVVQTAPAIYAWQAQIPGVGITPVDIPADGQVLVGVRATQLAGNSWRYELAIQNLTSDRAIGGVRVPLPAGAQPTNTGFHDVDYHSGEGLAATDWTVVAGPGELSWATDDYAVDPNANALRWGTLYNFWFDANVGPQLVQSVDLTLFKPGEPAALAVPLNQGPYRAGDLNCDGVVNFVDINAFVLALGDRAGYTAQFPACVIDNGDTNGDGACDFEDINPFVALLSG